MSRSFVAVAALLVAVLFGGWLLVRAADSPNGASSAPEPKVDQAALARARKSVLMLDDIYKTTIVFITDKYVNDADDLPAGTAAIELFRQIGEKGWHDVKLLDATGEPIDEENVASDAFEEAGIKALKSGSGSHEQVITKDGKPFLRSMTPVPVVMDKCIMCHSHYAAARDRGEPIGAVSYTIPIE